MTIIEAIEHAREIEKTSECEACKNEHKQLANWLSELVELRRKNEEMRKLLKDLITYTDVLESDGNGSKPIDDDVYAIASHEYNRTWDKIRNITEND